MVIGTIEWLLVVVIEYSENFYFLHTSFVFMRVIKEGYSQKNC